VSAAGCFVPPEKEPWSSGSILHFSFLKLFVRQRSPGFFSLFSFLQLFSLLQPAPAPSKPDQTGSQISKKCRDALSASS
jgi:hypothetical protein